MKQQIIELKKKLLLVELPEGAKIIKMEGKYRFGFKAKGLEADVYLGKLTDITEEQFAEMVKSVPHHTTKKLIYEDHTYYTDKPLTENGAFDTAKESFFSKLKVDGIYFSNRLGEKSKEEDFKLTGNSEQAWRMIEEDRSGQKPTWASIFYKNFQDKLKLWQEAQENVWNKDNTYVFEIL